METHVSNRSVTVHYAASAALIGREDVLDHVDNGPRAIPIYGGPQEFAIHVDRPKADGVAVGHSDQLFLGAFIVSPACPLLWAVGVP